MHPIELARLTRDSGGIYFVLPSEEFMRVRQREQAYSITQLKEYMPEYDNRLAYVERRNSSILRRQMHDVVLEGKAYLTVERSRSSLPNWSKQHLKKAGKLR